jgi:hypothetical protein
MRGRFLVAIVSVAVLAGVGCYDPNSIAAPDEVLVLTASPAAIPANGFSTSRITARISTVANRDVTISFTTSAGTLSSTSAQGPDSNGEVSVFLTSDSSPKTASVTAEVKEGTTVLASRSVTITFDLAAPDSIIKLSVSAGQIEADGVSSVLVRADANPAGAARTVSFKTTLGSFVRDAAAAVLEQSNVATGADGVALAQLFAPITAGTALITVTAGGFSASQTVSFVPALPDFIALSATPLEISRALETNTIDVQARLSRAIGTVTKNTRIDFSAVNDATGEAFGRFQDVQRSNDDETASAEFVPGTAAPTGLATITAAVAGNNNVLARIKVNILP